MPNLNADPEVTEGDSKAHTGNYGLKIFQSSLNLLAHILIGVVVGVSVLFSFSFGVPLGSTALHILLCVVGYQLLMSEAILALCPHNGWSSSLRLVDKKRAHTILQILGSSLAIVGSFIEITHKSVHFNTLHGKFGLVALVFTVVCLFNGFSSLYAFELRRFLPGNLSKISHILFGIVAFVTSCIALCYGFDKAFFTNWATQPFTYALIGMSAAFTFIIITNPIITAFTKTVRMVK